MSEKCRSNKCDDVDDDADAVDDVHDDVVDDDEHLTLPLKNAIHYVFRLTTSYGWGGFCQRRHHNHCTYNCHYRKTFSLGMFNYCCGILKLDRNQVKRFGLRWGRVRP